MSRGKTPEFDEYAIVLKGMLRVAFHGGALDVYAGQAVIAHAGEWVQYIRADEKGADTSPCVCLRFRREQ